MAYTHITHNERRSIERFLERGESIRGIAKKLSRSVSSISGEIKNNSVKGTYCARKAEHKARQKRKQSKVQCLRVAMHKGLKAYVTGHIMALQSPECISLRLKYVDTHLPYVSAKAIYKFIYSPHGRDLEQYLYSKRVKKKGGPKRGKRKVTLDGRRMIEKTRECRFQA